MQRTIKFRAWLRYEKEMSEVLVLDNQDERAVVVRKDGTVGWRMFAELELVQYTGLKDKNGVEIYDGDYIRYSTRTINESIFTHVCRVFQHESGTWRIEGYHEGNHSYETKGTVYEVHKVCEVIGNIYENPELAK